MMIRPRWQFRPQNVVLNFSDSMSDAEQPRERSRRLRLRLLQLAHLVRVQLRLHDRRRPGGLQRYLLSNDYLKLTRTNQRTLTKGEVSVYCWPPVYLVWIQLLCLCWISISFNWFVKSKPVKQEVSHTVILPPLVSPSVLWFRLVLPLLKEVISRSNGMNTDQLLARLL